MQGLIMQAEHTVVVDPHYRLWAEELGDPDGTPLLLVVGANASGVAWPDTLVDRLALRHRVVRYDHRDTGRSTRAFTVHPYAIRDLADDALTVLDALGIDRAHIVMSMGGTLVQLLLSRPPGAAARATVFATSALGAGLADPEGTGPALPGPDPRLLEMWAQMGDERGACGGAGLAGRSTGASCARAALPPRRVSPRSGGARDRPQWNGRGGLVRPRPAPTRAASTASPAALAAGQPCRRW